MLACVLGIQLLRALANKVQCGASADFSVLKKEGKKSQSAASSWKQQTGGAKQWM